MTGAVAALALAAALPSGGQRYRVEIAGEVVGTAELSVSCREERCAAAWESRVRAPVDAGGGVAVHRVEVEVDRAGRLRGGRAREVEDGRGRDLAGGLAGADGAVPATLAELVLAAEAGRDETCLEVVDEPSGERGRACARRAGGRVLAELPDARAEILGRPGSFPSEVRLPAQGTRFVADAGARVPSVPPRLHGTEVPGPPPGAGALRFCGVAADPEPPRTAAGAVPPPAAPGASCREKAARWIALAGARGVPARTAVGVAWDGGAFVWHAWAEAEVDGVWVPVDPTFRQSPARGPRFTLARFAPGDEGAKAAAGRRILACWGRGGVERSR